MTSSTSFKSNKGYPHLKLRVDPRRECQNLRWIHQFFRRLITRPQITHINHNTDETATPTHTPNHLRSQACPDSSRISHVQVSTSCSPLVLASSKRTLVSPEKATIASVDKHEDETTRKHGSKRDLTHRVVPVRTVRRGINGFQPLLSDDVIIVSSTGFNHLCGHKPKG
jgi:hypothetical protein